MRVAIAGLGPKGLHALERLLDHSRGLTPGVRLEIEIFEPHAVPGAGAIYDPVQPHYLLMNFAAEHLDMWWPGRGAVPAAERRSFVGWSGTDPAAYPPRAQVGRYLADGLGRLLHHTPAGVSIRLHRSAVAKVSAEDSAWAVTAGETTSPFDEVLIAIGHQPSWETELASSWDRATTLIPSVFPVTRWLSPAQIAPGATVTVRGFGLTFIDAALALTEGRGGVFERLDHPYRLRYLPSADDVAQILPYSRTGRPMLAKPAAGLAAEVPKIESIAHSGCARILALSEHADLPSELAAIVTDTAAAALAAAGGRRLTPAPGRPDPVAEVERSLAVGAGLVRPDMAWALGQAWRVVYPAVVTRLSGRRWTPGEMLGFRRLSADLERVAFGPPPRNAAKLLALIEAGRVSLDHIRRPRLETVDTVVDAVLPPAGARGLRSPLLEELVLHGHARLVPGGRGLEVTAGAACIGRDGLPTAGLSAIGRPTEDSVIGNDTLNRALHPHADRWARRVVRRAGAGPVRTIEHAGVA